MTLTDLGLAEFHRHPILQKMLRTCQRIESHWHWHWHAWCEAHGHSCWHHLGHAHLHGHSSRSPGPVQIDCIRYIETSSRQTRRTSSCLHVSQKLLFQDSHLSKK